MVSIIEGVDEIRNSSGELFQIGTIGFGHQSDWEVIERQEVSAAASVDIFWQDAVYEQVEVYWYLEVSADDDELNMRVSEDGSTFVSSAAAYSYELAGDQNSAGAAFETEGDSTTEWQVVLNQGNDTNEFSSGTAMLAGCDSATRVTAMTAHVGYVTGASREITVSVAGNRNAAAVLKGIQMLPSSGTLTGTVVVRGRRTVPVAFTSQDDWTVLSEKIADDDATIEFEPADFDITQYDEFEITVIDLVADTDFEDFQMLVSNDGGATYEVTSYHWGNNRFSSETGLLVTNATAGTFVEVARSVDNGAGEAANFTFRVNALDSANYKQFRYEGTTWSTSNLFKWDGMFSWRGGTDAINGIRFQMETNPIVSGKFRLRGRLKTPLGRPVQRWTEATLQTTGVTQADIATVPLAAGEAKVVRGFGTVTEVSTANQFSFNFIAHGKNDGGTSAEGAGAPIIDKLDSDGGNAWDFDVDVDDTTDAIRMRVTGEAATTLDWKIQYEVITEDNL